METTKGHKLHRHTWNVAGRPTYGTVRTCSTCGDRQIKLSPLGGSGVAWTHLDDELATLLATDPKRADDLRALRRREGALASLREVQP